MTKEVAIAVLQRIKPIPSRADGKSTTHILETIALDMAIKALEQTRWIPVSERLPEVDGDYLVTFKLSFMNFIEVCTFNKAGWNKGGYDDVIAWMPLPESYKVEKEDKE